MSPRVRLLLLLLLLAASSARAEFPASAERPLAPSLEAALRVAVAETRFGFLAFWSSWQSPLRVTRIAPDGTLQSVEPIRELVYPSFNLVGATSNGELVFAWGSCGSGDAIHPCAARFTAEGAYEGTFDLPVPSVRTIASNGDGFLVVGETAWNVVAVPLSRDGLPGSPFVIGSRIGSIVSVAAIDDDYFVAFYDGGTPAIARVSPRGHEESIRVVAPFYLGDLYLSASGDRLLIATGQLNALRFTITDSQLRMDTPWTAMALPNAHAELAPTSTGWIASAISPDGLLLVQSVAFDGRMGAMQTIEPRAAALDVAGSAGFAGLIWQSGGNARFAVLDAGGALLAGPATISLVAAPQMQPAGAAGTEGFLAAWSESMPDGTPAVKARAFDSSAMPRAPATLMPFRGIAQSEPAVAWNGEAFLVVWSEGEEGAAAVRGARVGPDGLLLDPEGFPLFGSVPSKDYLSGHWRSAAVAWSGAAWIVVSADTRGRIGAVRVSAGGALLDAEPVPISSGGALEVWQREHGPAIACNGAQCLTAWLRPEPDVCQITCPPPAPSVRGQRIAADLTPAGPSLLFLDERWSVAGPETAVSWNEAAATWLVSWSAEGRQRVARDGRMLDSPLHEVWSRIGSLVAMPEGEGWRLAWEVDGIVHGWSRSGVVSEVTERFAAGPLGWPSWESNPVLVSGPRPLMLFVRHDPPNAGSPAVMARFLDELEADISRLTIEATRVDAFRVRVSLTADVTEVSGFRIQRLAGEWRDVGYVKAADRVTEIALPRGRAARLRAVAELPSGPLVSNVLEIPGERRRIVAR